MSDDSGKSKKLSLSGGGKLTLGGIEAGTLRANTGGAGRRTVQVEVRRKRAPAAPHRATTPTEEPVAAPTPPPRAVPSEAVDTEDRLTAQERAARVRALQEGMRKPDAAPGDDALAEGTDAAAPAESVAEAQADVPAEPLDPAEARRAAELAAAATKRHASIPRPMPAERPLRMSPRRPRRLPPHRRQSMPLAAAAVMSRKFPRAGQPHRAAVVPAVGSPAR